MSERTESVTAAAGRIVLFPSQSANPGLRLVGPDIEGEEASPATSIKIGAFERRRIQAGDLVLAHPTHDTRAPLARDAQLHAPTRTTERK